MRSPDGDVISYRISPLRRSVLWMILGPFLLMGLVMCFFKDSQLAGIVLSLMMAVALGFWHWLVSYTRLVFSPQGVVLRQLGWKLEASWEQIDHLRLERGREGFVVKEPMQGRGVRMLAGASGFGYYGSSMYTDEQRYWMECGQWIPVEPFMYAFRKGSMKEEIERLAPGLLARDASGMAARLSAAVAENGEAVPSAPSLRPLKSKLTWWLNVYMLTIALVVPAATMANKRQIEWGVHFLFAFALGPFLIWKSARSCRNAFRSGSRLLGVLFIFFFLLAALVEVAFFQLWLHPK